MNITETVEKGTLIINGYDFSRFYNKLIEEIEKQGIVPTHELDEIDMFIDNENIALSLDNIDII